MQVLRFQKDEGSGSLGRQCFKYPRASFFEPGRVVNIDEEKRIIGIPDSVSLDADSALVDFEEPPRKKARLFVFSSKQLTPQELQELEQRHRETEEPYPLLITNHACALGYGNKDTPPRDRNFYYAIKRANTEGVCNTDEFVEYRHFADRHRVSTTAWDPVSGCLYRLALQRTRLVLIMPSNFTRTSPRTGYFTFPQQYDNLIIHATAAPDVLLSGKLAEKNKNLEITEIDTEYDTRLVSLLRKLYARMKFPNIHVDRYSVHAADRYIIATCGVISS